MDKPKRIIALGFFDGVHLGHGALLKQVKTLALAQNARASAFTFDKSPSAVLTGDRVPLLSSVAQRKWLMQHYYGIEEVIVASFERMMRMPWQEFVVDYLIGELGTVHVVAGHDFHFGHKGQGTPQRLFDLCRQLGIGCDIIQPIEQEGRTISSTYIRTLIERGEMAHARKFLGHPHFITGELHKYLFEANPLAAFSSYILTLCEEMVRPAFDSYATQIVYAGSIFPAITVITAQKSNTPCADAAQTLSVFTGAPLDLSNKMVQIFFHRQIREAEQFAPAQEFPAQLKHDMLALEEYLSKPQ